MDEAVQVNIYLKEYNNKIKLNEGHTSTDWTILIKEKVYLQIIVFIETGSKNGGENEKINNK